MSSVRATEQKVKVGDLNINYVRSVLSDGTPSKTLLLLPGAMGNLFKVLINDSYGGCNQGILL
jgi:hypothetical protein